MALIGAACAGPGGAGEAPATAGAAPAERPSDEANEPVPAGDAPGSDRGSDAEGVREPEATEPTASEAPREIVYKVTPEGLVIEVEGVEIRPKAQPVRKGGGWAIAITAEAEAKDDKMHRLLAPERGPLMMAARVRRGKQTVEVTDERSGEDEMFVMSGAPETLERTFPDEASDAFRRGDDVTLIVGLWGLGVEADERRPVRKLFQVRMTVGSAKPQPVIEPPPSMR